MKKHSRGEFNFEAVTAKMQALSFFDQHVVTWQCVVQVLEMLSAFSAGSSSYLPVQEHVSFLLDLMELASSICGLIDVCVQVGCGWEIGGFVWKVKLVVLSSRLRVNRLIFAQP